MTRGGVGVPAGFWRVLNVCQVDVVEWHTACEGRRVNPVRKESEYEQRACRRKVWNCARRLTSIALLSSLELRVDESPQLLNLR